MGIDWRSQKLEYSHMHTYALERLQAYYPGRFVTMGDLADANDAEMLAVPRIGKTILEHFRAAVADAKSLRVDPETEFHRDMKKMGYDSE